MGEKAKMIKATTLMGLKPTLPNMADNFIVLFSFMANIPILSYTFTLLPNKPVGLIRRIITMTERDTASAQAAPT